MAFDFSTGILGEELTPEQNKMMMLGLLSSAFTNLGNLGAGRPQESPMYGLLSMQSMFDQRNQKSRADKARQKDMQAAMKPAVPAIPAQPAVPAQTVYKPAPSNDPLLNNSPLMSYMDYSPEMLPEQTPEIPAVPGRDAQPGGFDANAYYQAALMNPDNPDRDMAFKAMLEQQKPEDMFGKVMPHAYTPESLSRFQRSGNYSDLVPYGGGSNFGKVNPGQFTPESIAKFAESGNYGDLIPFRSPVQVDTGGQKILLDPGTQRMRTFDVTPRPGEMPSLQAAQETAKGEARLGVERQAEAPKALARAESADAKFVNLQNTIARAKQQANAFSTGLGAQVLSGIGGTQAYDLAATLDTVKANLGFDELQQMRDNSPTGGALGQVAVQEIQYLQSVLANVQQAQSKEQLVKNLDSILEAKRLSNERIRRAYEQTYGQKENGKPGTLTPEQILNIELRDALSRGDTQNVNAIRREMKSRGFNESGGKTPNSAPRIRKYNPKTGRIE